MVLRFLTSCWWYSILCCFILVLIILCLVCCGILRYWFGNNDLYLSFHLVYYLGYFVFPLHWVWLIALLVLSFVCVDSRFGLLGRCFGLVWIWFVGL